MVKIVGWKECIAFEALKNEIIPYLHIHDYTLPRVLGIYISICSQLRELALSVNFPAIYKQIDPSYSWSPCGIGTLDWSSPEFRQIDDDLATVQRIGENYGTGSVICDLEHFASAPQLVVLTLATFEHLTELRIKLDCGKFDDSFDIELPQLRQLELSNAQHCTHPLNCSAMMGLLQSSDKLESIVLERFLIKTGAAMELLIPSGIKHLSLRDTGVPLDVLNRGLLDYRVNDLALESPTQDEVSMCLQDSLQVMLLMSNLSIYEAKKQYFYSITIKCCNRHQSKVVRNHLFRCMEFMCLLHDSLDTQSLHDQCKVAVPHASFNCTNAISTLCAGQSRKPISSFIHFVNNKSCSILNIPSALNM